MKMDKHVSVTIGRLCKGMMLFALLTAGVGQAALAAQYTAQEKANMQIVEAFYAALDAADAKGNTQEAIVGIAGKYIAPDYKQHAFGGQSGRENFIKMFQGPPAGAPAGPPPGSPRPPMEPAKLVALMAEGDLVVRITTRGPNMIWNLFRVQNGQLAEHWDAGTGGGAPPAGAPPGVPVKK